MLDTLLANPFLAQFYDKSPRELALPQVDRVDNWLQHVVLFWDIMFVNIMFTNNCQYFSPVERYNAKVSTCMTILRTC